MRISTHFSYKEALYLPQWKRRATSTDGLTIDIIQNLKLLFSKLDLVRDYFNRPIVVHVAYRPTAYNKLVGGASKSSHMVGKAVDFHIQGLNCDDVRKTIIDNNLLDLWDMRMELNSGGGWIHLDTNVSPGCKRTFSP